ncbi:hypothetical protein AB833_15660 [Chromatiales bacterium (ex Bugula neritina AB1)]|nr:hypothetical protein AB833_15660 [Chromatiales bacterium (ex Bugula neritina AB1)]
MAQTPAFSSNQIAGARSLIEGAIGAVPGETLAIIAEDPALGIYDDKVPACVAGTANSMGIKSSIITVGNCAGLEQIPPAVTSALIHSDHVLFQSRLGDTLRFSDIPGGAGKTMSYALDIDILGSASCTVPHRVLERIRSAYEQHADTAESWRVTCPNGTDISGTQDIQAVARGEAEDFTVTRFPVCAPRPISCSTATGVVAITHWLMASGNKPYPDDELLLPDLIMAQVENGRIIDLSGSAKLVDKVRCHYTRVGKYLNLDPWEVHSWHAGINPGCSYRHRAESNLERWGKVAFANPRYLHFHTCGSYAPGEIAWSLFDATVELNGKLFWNKGDFVYLQHAEVQAIVTEEGLQPLVVSTDIGIPESQS